MTGCQAAPAGPVLSAPPEPADPAPTVGPLSAFELIPDTATVATLTDFDRIRASGLASRIQQHARAGGAVIGICGGYQMLGRAIHDPDAAESRILPTHLVVRSSS